MFIVQMRELKFRKSKWPSQGLTAHKGQSWDANPGVGPVVVLWCMIPQTGC
jgi:hypothetical protein